MCMRKCVDQSEREKEEGLKAVMQMNANLNGKKVKKHGRIFAQSGSNIV